MVHCQKMVEQRCRQNKENNLFYRSNFSLNNSIVNKEPMATRRGITQLKSQDGLVQPQRQR